MITKYKVLLSIAMVLLVSSKIYADPSGAKWVFDVLLNGKNIGEHEFSLSTRDDGHLQVQSNANMSVKFLFFEAFKYEHEARELWRDGCLQSIEAVTSQNDNVIMVNGAVSNQYFAVEAKKNNALLEGCIRSFAYWDLQTIIHSERLLNPQTGEYMDVEVIPAGPETIQVANLSWQSEKFTLIGEKLHIDLWYGPDGKWLKLRSKLENDRELIYHLQDPVISI